AHSVLRHALLQLRRPGNQRGAAQRGAGGSHARHHRPDGRGVAPGPGLPAGHYPVCAGRAPLRPRAARRGPLLVLPGAVPRPAAAPGARPRADGRAVRPRFRAGKRPPRL
nr:hypothetical protein [Tanacetum cinerariifolium]